jgi:hypothetical protein
MAEMANPKKIIDGYKPTSYFGAPARLDRYETDPQKLGADGTLTGALKGLARGGAGFAGNVGVGLYNAVAKTGTPTTAPAERNAAFPEQNLARYRTPRAAPENQFSVRLGQDIQAMDTPMLPAHTPGQRLLRSAPAAAPAPQAAPAASRLSRSAPAGRPLPATTPTVSWAAPEEAVPAPERGYIESDGVKYYIPGSQAYDGVGATGAPQFENAPVVVPQPGTPGYMGSQAEWEASQLQEQKVGLARRFGVPLMNAVTAAGTLDETVRNNSATNFREFMKAGSEVAERDAMLPGKVEEQGVKITKGRLENRFYPEATRADINYKNSSAAAATTNAAAIASNAEVNKAESASVIEMNLASAAERRRAADLMGDKAGVAAAKNDEIKFTNAANIYKAIIAQDPSKGAEAMKAYSDSIQLHDTLQEGGTVDYTPEVPAVKGTFGFGKKPAIPARATFRKAGAAAQTEVAPAGTRAKVNGKILTSDGEGGWR